MQNPEYAATLAISSTSVKQFKNMPPIEWQKLWITKEKEQKSSIALKKGSLTDDLLFDPSIVEDRYLVMEFKKPSDTISYIVENVFNVNIPLIDLRDKIIEYAKIVPMDDNKTGYGQSWNEDTLVNKIIDGGSEYYEFLKTTNGKCVVGASEYMASLGMAEAIKKSEECKQYLNPRLNKFQFQIITDDDFPDKLKGCLDILHINDKKKQIRIVDFKTCDNAFYFISNIFKFGYLEQVSFYTNLVAIWLQENYEKYTKYEILPPMNIVIDSRYNTPYFYEYNFKDIQAAWNGYFKYGKMQNGIKDTIKEIQWHIIEDKWLYPMEHYLYGKINLSLISHNE